MKNVPTFLTTLVITCVVTVIFFLTIGNAIDTHFDNQDAMLCKSAKVSGNEEYLEKCGCYYGGENIRCIHSKQTANK